MIDLKMLESASLMLNAYALRLAQAAKALHDPSDKADALEASQDANRAALEVRKAGVALAALETAKVALHWGNDWVVSREPGSHTAWYELQEWVKAREAEVAK